MLTLSQRKTHEFIKAYFAEHGHSPTAAEIAEGIGIKSRGVVHRYLKALAQAGHIALTPNRHRNISLLSSIQDAFTGTVSLPLVGTIAAGCPIEAIPQQETIDLASVFLGTNRYALKVKGDSMIDEGILDGDIVICEKRDTADNGQIVVALIDQEEATLKRLQRNLDNTVTLHPANSQLKPIIYLADRITIQGIYLGLLRCPQ